VDATDRLASARSDADTADDASSSGAGGGEVTLRATTKGEGARG
jgi:hypothetical protein